MSAERVRVAAVLAADAHHQALEQLAGHFQGSEVPNAPQCVFLFGSVAAAVQCAYEALQRLALNAKAASPGAPLPRLAVHVGDVVETGSEAYGDGITVAIRLQAAAAAGALLVSGEARKLVEGKLPYAAQNLGKHQLPGLGAPLEIFAMVTGITVPKAAPAPAPAVAAAPAPVPAPAPAPVAAPAAAAPPVPSEPPRDDSLVGRQVGPCRLEGILGKGGMGTVYRGRHLALDRVVAVKVLASATMGEAAADRLLAEARAAAAVDDPRVVQIYDAGNADGLRFVVMQLVEGETLESRVAKHGALKPDAARDVIRQVLLGLSAAHKKGLVHRDVKPANIMLDKSGGVKLLDFGLAASVTQGSGSSAPEGPTGSFDFMPPEQGFDAAPTPQQDLYALGATWYFALAGLPPYSGCGWAEMLLQHREAPVPDIRAANREVTLQNSNLIKRLMEKDPQRRPASADEVLKELDQAAFTLNVAAPAEPGAISLLPPPPEPQPEGVAADPTLQAIARAVPRAAPGEELPSALPPPPPALPAAHGMSPAAKGLIAAVFLVLFAPKWLSVGPPDWLGFAAACAAGLCGLALADGPTLVRRGVSTALFLGLIIACWNLTGGAPSMGVETGVAGGVGLVLGAAGLVLGFWTTARDRLLGSALLAGSAVTLFVVATAMALPPGASWSAGIPEQAGAAWAALRDSGGVQRWTSVALAGLGVVVARLAAV